jgi:hypothetical protein
MESLTMEDAGIFLWSFFFSTVILWPFGTFCGHLVYFYPFWHEKSGNPGAQRRNVFFARKSVAESECHKMKSMSDVFPTVVND